MQKEIKKLIETKLYCKDNSKEWQEVIDNYYQINKDNEKGVALKYRYFEKRNYWECLRKLQKVKFYSEKDNFYKLINEIIIDIALRAVYKDLINPYEYEANNECLEDM